MRDRAREVRVVEAWHDALNSGDADRLVQFSQPDVEVGGPRGTGRGAKLLRDWVERADIRLEPWRVFHRADKVVVEQRAEWRSADSVQTVASVFSVHDGRVASVLRYGDLTEALRAAGLDESCEVETGIG